MIPIGFNGIRWANLGVAGSFVIAGADGPSMQSIEVDRAGDAPLIVGLRQGSRTMTVNFTVLPITDPDGIAQDFELTRRNLLAALNPRDTSARTMVGVISASDPTEYQIACRMGQYRSPSPTTIAVDFLAADDRWKERTDTTTIALAISGDTVIPLENRGGATADLTLKFGWTVNKITANAYKYKRTVGPITNTGSRMWKRVRLTLDLGDTSAWVTAGKAQFDGDDVRIRRGRRELARTLTNFNTKRSFAHIFDTIAASDSVTYEVWYGNNGVTAPQTLSIRTTNGDDYAADDLEGDDGTATAGGAATLTDSGKGWEVNRWAGGFIQIVAGLGAGKRRKILSNTATVITTVRNWGGSNVDNTSVYVMWMSGIAAWGGLATSSGTTSTLTDTSQSFIVDELVGASLYNVTKAIGPFPVASNTSTVITINGSMTTPVAADVYYLERYGAYSWMVNDQVYNTDHRDLWRTNHYFSAGGRIWYGDLSPGGWVPWLMLDNQDDFAQGRIVNEGSGGGHATNWRPGQYSRRSVRSENTWPEKKQADGVSFYDPRGFIGYAWDYRMKNAGSPPVGVVEVRTQERDGDTWQVVASDATSHASLTRVTSGGATGYFDFTTDDVIPVRIWTGVLPADDDGTIESTSGKAYTVELRSNTYRRAFLSLDDVGGLVGGIWTVGSEVGIYDLRVVALLGGGPNSEPPLVTVTVGPGLGNGSNFVGLESGQELWINGDPASGKPLVGIYSSDTLRSRAPWGAMIRDTMRNLDGNLVHRVKSRLLLPPGNLIANGDNASGWTLANSSGVTATLATGTGAMLPGHTSAVDVNITVTPAGAWNSTLVSQWIDVTPDTMYEFGFWMRRNGLDVIADPVVSMKLEWSDGVTSNAQDPDQTVTAVLATNNVWVTNGGGEHTYAGPPADGGTYTYGPTIRARITLKIAGTGSDSGHWRIGAAILGGRNLYVSELHIGTLTARASWREAVYS